MSLTTFRRLWTATMVLMTSAPYFINWYSASPGSHYTWILPPYPEDSLGYLAWARQAAEGALLFKLKYTALPHSAFLFHPLFLVCGWLGALFGGNVALAFWMVKAVGVVLFMSIFYRYNDYLRLSARESIAASVLVGISSGVGGILALLGLTSRWAMLSTDLWMPEVSTFWSLLWNPLFPFSLGTMLMSILWVDRATRDSRVDDMWRGGVAAGVLALLHPYSVALLFVLTISFALVRQRARAWQYLWCYFASALPFAIYIAAVARLHPLVAQHSAAGRMDSPAFVEYLLGFGLPLLIAVLGIVLMRRALLNRVWPLLVWFVAALALAYAPVWFQRKLIFGAQIPLAIMAAVIASAFFKRLTSRVGKPFATMLVIALLPIFASTSIYALARQHRDVRQNITGAYYVSDEMLVALDQLREHSRRDDIVLATESTSRFIPALVGDTTVWGHWAMTVDRKQRYEQIRRILDSASGLDDEARAREFWDMGVRFIFADGELKLSIEQHPFLWGVILKRARKIFDNGTVVIYERARNS